MPLLIRHAKDEKPEEDFLFNNLFGDEHPEAACILESSWGGKGGKFGHCTTFRIGACPLDWFGGWAFCHPRREKP